MTLNPVPFDIPEQTRAYIYRVLFALLPIALFLGYLTAPLVALILVAAQAVLGIGLAVSNTSTDA